VRALRSVSGRFLIALVVLVLVALVTNYLFVVPSLRNQLVNARLDELQRTGKTLANSAIKNMGLDLQPRVEASASSLNARIAVFEVLPAPGHSPMFSLVLLADSVTTQSETITSDRIAIAAARTGEVTRGTVRRSGTEYGEVAVPIASDFVILLSGSVNEVNRSVETVRNQLLIAAIPAFMIALGIGLFGAHALTSRLRRLERGVDRIADGSFEEPIEDKGQDEVGQLARSFERMRQRLAQLEEARREFIANASHELRTPIFALSGSLELLSEEEMDEESRKEFLETMRSQVERLQKLATALLDLSRLDAGKLELTLEPLALAPLAEALRTEFEAAAELSGHRLSSTIEAEAIVGADEQRVLQIGRVLLENALVHTPEGVTVTIGTAESDGRGQLIVEDSGRGIPAEEQERVFERFFRLRGEQSSGSGLGLAIAREWARRMNGELTLESRPGETRFTLSLPATTAAKR
jgi:signal transduction histidine kinase